MPQLVVIAVAGATLWAGYSWLARESRSVRDAVEAAEAELRRRVDEARAAETAASAASSEADMTRADSVEMKELPKLELDPQTGIYRVKA